MVDEGSGAVADLDVEESFTGFDGDEVGPSKPGEGAPKPQARQAAPAQAPAGETPEQAERRIIESQRRQGETLEDTAIRLYAANRQGYDRLKHEKRDLQNSLTRLEAQQVQQRAEWEPFLRDYYRQRQAETQREQLASIPDREADPVGYSIWLAEQNLIRTNAAEEQRQAALAEEQRLEEVAQVDEVWAGQLQEALAVPEFQADFELLVNYAKESARVDFPSATPAQIDQLIENANLLAMRNALTSGIGVEGYVWQKASILRRMMGSQQPAQPQAQRPTNSATVKRLAAAGERQRKAGSLAGPSGPGAAGGLPGQGVDILAMNEDDFVQAVLANRVDVNKLSKQKFGTALD